VSNEGDTPSATLTGNYKFFMGPASNRIVFYDETDRVTVRSTVDSSTFVGVLGGGIKYPLEPHFGLRLDVRVLLSKNTVGNLVDTGPVVATLTPALVASSPTNPSIVWSNNSSSGVQSSLSESLNGFQTFRGSGIETQLSIASGFFFRF
jgi:hypothetical protein